MLDFYVRMQRWGQGDTDVEPLCVLAPLDGLPLIPRASRYILLITLLDDQNSQGPSTQAINKLVPHGLLYSLKG